MTMLRFKHPYLKGGPMVFKYGGAPPTERQLEERAKQLQADIEAVGMARTFKTCERCNGRGSYCLASRRSRGAFTSHKCPDCAGIGLVYDRYRAEGHELAVPEPLALTATGCDPPDAPESRALRAMRRALQRMSEREQEVLLATMEYRITGHEGSSLPPGVAQQLADQLGVSATHLRQIRLRALRKLRTYFEELLSQERDAK